jgi:hypothetical protein
MGGRNWSCPGRSDEPDCQPAMSMTPQSPACDPNASRRPGLFQAKSGDLPLAGAPHQRFLAIGHAYGQHHAVAKTDGDQVLHRMAGDGRNHGVGPLAEFERGLAHRTILAREGPDYGRRCAPEEASHLPLFDQDKDLTLAG